MDLSRQHSKGITEVPRRRWDYVVTMGCGDNCPHVESNRRVAWNVPDPTGLPIEEVRQVRDQIISSVQALIQHHEDVHAE